MEIVQLLVEAGADMDTGDLFDRTPLHWAAKRGKGIEGSNSLT